ncbi:hypothetical protein EEL34_08755, partial [Muribaculaceae bacterium Isolate-039 (Harlan)]
IANTFILFNVFIMNALAIHLYLTIRYINLSFNHFGDFYRIIVLSKMRQKVLRIKIDLKFCGKSQWKCRHQLT